MSDEGSSTAGGGFGGTGDAEAQVKDQQDTPLDRGNGRAAFPSTSELDELARRFGDRHILFQYIFAESVGNAAGINHGTQNSGRTTQRSEPDPPEPDAVPPLPWPRSAFKACKGDPEALALLIATALLAGAPRSTIQSITNLIAPQVRQLMPKSAAADKANEATAPPLMDFSRSTTDLLDAFKVEAVADGGAWRLVFREEGHQSALLTFLWYDFVALPELAARLVEFSGTLSHHPEVEVRVSLGAAIGRLAAADFDKTWFTVLNHWFIDDSLRPLDALSSAIAVAMSHTASRAKVRDRVLSWARGEAGIDGYYASAHIVSGALATGEFDTAVSVMQTLLARRSAKAVEGGITSFLGLVYSAATGSGEVSPIFEALVAAEPHRDVRALGIDPRLVAFLAVAEMRIPYLKTPKSSQRRVLLLEALLRDPRALPSAARLFNASLAAHNLPSSPLDVAWGFFDGASRSTLVSNVDRANANEAAWNLFSAMHKFGDDRDRRWLEGCFTRWTKYAKRDQDVSRPIAILRQWTL